MLFFFNQPPSSTFSQTWGWSFVSQFDASGWSFNGFTVNKLKINTRVFGMLSVVMVPVALNDSVKMQSAACFLWGGKKCTEKNHYCSSVITGFLIDCAPGKGMQDNTQKWRAWHCGRWHQKEQCVWIRHKGHMAQTTGGWKSEMRTCWHRPTLFKVLTAVKAEWTSVTSVSSF